MKSCKFPQIVTLQHITLCILAGWVFSNWLRAADALAGRTIYTFVVLLSATLLGGGLGAATIRLLCKRTSHAKARIACGISAWAVLLVVQLLTLPTFAFQWNQTLLLSTQRTFTLYLTLIGQASLAWGLATGFVFGWIMQAYEHDGLHLPENEEKHLPKGIRSLIALLIGYYGFRFCFPGLTVEQANRYAVIVMGVLLASVLGNPATTLLRRSVRMGLPLAVTIIVALFMRSVLTRPSVLGEGSFARMLYRDNGFARGTPKTIHSSAHHVIATFDDKDYQSVLTLDGRPILFGNRFYSMRTMVGYIPLLLRPDAKLTAIVGPEAARFFPYFVHGGQKCVTLAESDSTVVQATLQTFCGANTNELQRLNAAMRFTRLSANVYDLVLIAPEPIWMRGASHYYARDTLNRYKRCLIDDGLLALHLDTRAMTEPQFAALAQTFLSVFKEAQLWNVGMHDWLLVGGNHPIKTPLDKAADRFDGDSVFLDRIKAGKPALPEALACMITATEGLHAWMKKQAHIPSFSRLTWQVPRTFFSHTESLLRPASFEAHRKGKLDWILPGQMDFDLYLDLLKSIDAARDARAMSVRAMDALAQGKHDQCIAIARMAAAITSRDVLLTQVAERIELEARRRMTIGDFKGAASCYQNLLLISPGHALFHFGMGFALRGSGNANGAFDHLSKAIALAPDQIPYRLALAQLADANKRFREADEQFQAILAREPNNSEALFLYAKSLGNEARKPKQNIPLAIKYAEYACKLTKWKNTEYVYGLADLYIEGGRVLEGMGLKRTLKTNSTH